MMVKSYRPAGVGMLPAQPGTYLLHAYFDDNHIDLVKSNVLGWQVCSERSLTPLAIDPRAAEADAWCVAHPDGRVECSDGRCWDSLDLWVGEQRRQHSLGSVKPAVKPAPFPQSSAPYAAQMR